MEKLNSNFDKKLVCESCKKPKLIKFEYCHCGNCTFVLNEEEANKQIKKLDKFNDNFLAGLKE